MARKRKRSRGGSGSGVSRRSLLLLAGTGALGVTGVYSSGAFDSVSGDRAFGVGTSSDDTALLGIDIEEREGVDGETITLLELTNRFDGPINSIDAEIVSAADGPVDPNSIEAPMGLQPGESASISADLDCGSDLDRTVEVAITAAGSGQSVDLTRSVEVSCASSEKGEMMAERTQVMSAEAIGDDDSIVEFTLETDGSDEVVLTGLGIDYADSGDAVQINNQGQREADFDGDGFLNLRGNDAIEFGDEPKDFEEDGDDGAYETIAGGETTIGTLQEFLSEGPGRSGGPVNMGGTTLEITLEFQDGSSDTYTVDVS